jgi:hypothetical protein
VILIACGDILDDVNAPMWMGESFSDIEHTPDHVCKIAFFLCPKDASFDRNSGILARLLG